MSLSTPTATVPKGIITQASECVAAVDDDILGEQHDETKNGITTAHGAVAAMKEHNLTPNYAATSRKRQKLVTGACMKTTKMSRKRHVLGSVMNEEGTALGDAVVVVEPDQTQSMEYLNFIDTNFNRQQPSHISLAFAAQQSSVSTLDDNFTPWATTDAQDWQPRPHGVFQQQRWKGGSIQIPSQDQLPAARVGPVHPLQPPHLASILALQQARRIAADQQYLVANNPLAVLNTPYQHLINDSPPLTMHELLSLRPGVGIPGPAFPPWWSLAIGSPCSMQGLSLPLTPPLTGFPATPETVYHNLMNFVTAGTMLQQQGAGRSPLVLPQPHREHVASTVPLQLPCFTIHVAGDSGADIPSGSSGAASKETVLTDRPTYTMESIGPDVPISLPTMLFQPADEDILSPYQILLRQQIEVFSATSDDADTHARGRNKPIMTGQVGIRCRHCSCIIPNRRKKGAVYFPFALVGLYQAAQNMGQSHFNQHSICSEMPQEVKNEFVDGVVCKSGMGSGKIYWARSATSIGLVDTADHGIRFIRDLVLG
jgi:hypothetical protein